MAGKKTTETTNAKICNICGHETYAYAEIKTKRGSNQYVCKSCMRGACNNVSTN